MTQRFTIPSRLPGLNELLGWSTSFYLRGGKRLSKYTECKRNLTDGIAALAKAARLKPVERCHLTFYWTEPNRRRDPDNIAAGGRKLILDALVKAGVLQNDGWQQISAWQDVFDVGKVAKVTVEILELPVCVN